MTLRRNDMVMATFTREQAFDENFIKGLREYVREKFESDASLDKIDVLLRVKKMDATGPIYFLPHDIAKNEDNYMWKSSPTSLKLYNTRKVYVSFMGRIQNG